MSSESDTMDFLSGDNEEIEIAGMVGSEEQVNSVDALYRRFAVSPDEPGDYRLNAVNLNGVDEMSTDAVREFLARFEPFRIEWVNDHSCNIIFECEERAAQCIMAIGAPPDGGDHACPSSEYCWTANGPDGYQLQVRFAKLQDVKRPKAYLESRYYRRHGNPKLGGIRGIVSKDTKLKIFQDPSLALKIRDQESHNGRWGLHGESVKVKHAVDGWEVGETFGGKMEKRDMPPTYADEEEHLRQLRSMIHKPGFDLREFLNAKRSLAKRNDK
uniref:Nuclear cap-binding protein subunit 3 n=1 Tax=Trichuris muris TaxID=70415 RepID=A0A5S6Q411_TRIMR